MFFFLQIRKPPEVESPQIESPHPQVEPPQSSGSSIQSFESDDSITPLSSVSNVRARSDDVLLLRRILTKIELLQKINEDNQKKLCKLGEDMKSIKEKISVLSFNKESLDVIIKKSSEELIEHSIYPIPGDYKEMAEEPPEVEPPQIESPHPQVEPPQSSGSSIQSFESDDSITPLSSVSNVRARSDDVLLLRRILTKIELLQKINEDNQKKLCKLGEDMKSIKEKISVLSFNKESLDVIIKKSSEELIEHSIYSIPGDYKEMVEEVLRKTNNDFFLSLSDQWDGYFEKKMKKAAIKASIFKIFDKLPPINSNTIAAEITAWKRSPIVLECYKKLFTEIKNTSEKYIVRIIKNAWTKKEFISDSHTAWCVSIAEILLNPNNEYIQITEDVVQPFVEKNLVKLPTLGETQARLEKVINKKKMKQTVTLRKSQKKDDNGDDDDDYNNNNVNNEDDFQIIEDDRRFTNN
ncbi:hypothetical protein Glove_581g10 [Diversispora epigaea]|uniref:Uncharacterized protein n=1 Tax=Diversispora epigaea TaxID=1348612 RepID=A0A397GA41_9GLOM|nr:hypothetical protein Glove_581g10 [Diversispora epigaea]